MDFIIPQYDPANHYWVVAGDKTLVYSSARAGYVPAEDVDYLAWREAGFLPTHIVSEADLREVLAQQYPAGWFDPNAEARAMRDQRNALITACDWTVLPDAPLTTAKKAEWKAYRQALRDLTSQVGFPQQIEWPVQPGK